jgi:hypothetical protein
MKQRTSNLVPFLSLGLVVLVTASCGDVVRSNDSPVMLTVDSLTAGDGNTFNSDVIGASSVIFNDIGSATLGVIMKDFTIAPTTNNDVTISRYRVEYRRADGRNTPGVDVPYPFDGALTQKVPANGTAQVSFELVRHVAKKESPLVQLRTNPNRLSAITDVTFYGTDQVGNDVSATGSMLITFGDFGE